jgi:predicted Zn-dependent peptidase
MKTLLVLAFGAASLSAQPLPAVKLPPFTKRMLPNGATVYLVRKPDVPMISVRVAIKGGLDAEPADLPGIASMTAELVRRGTKTRTAGQFNEELDAIGASLGSSSGRDAGMLYMTFLSRHTAKALALLSDVLMNPAFPEAEVKKVLAQRLDSVRAMKDNPGGAIQAYFNPFFFPPGHPYARAATGSEASLQKITRGDIVQWHSRAWAARNMTFIAAGDFDEQAMSAEIAKLAGAVPAGGAFVWPKPPAPPSFDSARLLLIDKPDATQTYFVIAQPGIHRTHPDRVALEIINTLFGGRFTSMLNDELRVNSGLTYGARSMVEMDRLPGAIAINSYTKTETTVQAIDLALDVLKRLTSRGIDAEQLLSARNYIKGKFPTGELETADQVASILADLDLHGLNKGEIDDYFSRLDALTLEQVNAVARKHYRLDNLQFLLIGNAAKIQDGVKKYAPKMKVHPIREPGFEVPGF